jgi:hypothetical protein
MDCQVSTAEPQTPACKQPLSSTDLFLKLLPPSMTRDVASAGDTFGLALTEKDRPGTNVIIFYGRVAELARAESLYKWDILAAVMAHEIGHLLLLGTGHSPTGIMRAKLNRWDLLQAGRGQLKFTPEQSLLIRDEVAARQAGSTQTEANK